MANNTGAAAMTIISGVELELGGRTDVEKKVAKLDGKGARVRANGNPPPPPPPYSPSSLLRSPPYEPPYLKPIKSEFDTIHPTWSHCSLFVFFLLLSPVTTLKLFCGNLLVLSGMRNLGVNRHGEQQAGATAMTIISGVELERGGRTDVEKKVAKLEGKGARVGANETLLLLLLLLHLSFVPLPTSHRI